MCVFVVHIRRLNAGCCVQLGVLLFFLTTVGGSFNSGPFWHLGADLLIKLGLKLLIYFNNVYPTFYFFIFISNVRLLIAFKTTAGS